MANLLEKIRRAIEKEDFVVTNHADDRLRERGIMIWQIIGEIGEA